MPGINLESIFTSGGIAGEAFGLAGELVNAPIRRAQMEDKRAADKDARDLRDKAFRTKQLDAFGSQLETERAHSIAASQRMMASAQSKAGKAGSAIPKSFRAANLKDMAGYVTFIKEKGMSGQEAKDAFASKFETTLSDYEAYANEATLAHKTIEESTAALDEEEDDAVREGLYAKIAAARAVLPEDTEATGEQSYAAYGGFDTAERQAQYTATRREQTNLRDLDISDILKEHAGARSAKAEAAAQRRADKVRKKQSDKQSRIQRALDEKKIADESQTHDDFLKVTASEVGPDADATKANAAVKTNQPDLFAMREQNSQIAMALPKQNTMVQTARTQVEANAARVQSLMQMHEDALTRSDGPASAFDKGDNASAAKIIGDQLSRALRDGEGLSSALQEQVTKLHNMTATIQNSGSERPFHWDGADLDPSKGTAKPEAQNLADALLTVTHNS